MSRVEVWRTSEQRHAQELRNSLERRFGVNREYRVREAVSGVWAVDRLSGMDDATVAAERYTCSAFDEAWWNQERRYNHG